MEQRPFAAFDIDGTLIRWQLYHAIADELVKLGYIDKETFSEIKESRMNWKRRTHTESFREYENKLVQLYGKVLTGLSYEHFNEAAENVFLEYKDQAYIFSRELIKELKAKNYLLFAISGSQIEIVKMIANYYGFDDYIGTEFVHEGSKFTGEIKAALGKKHEILESFIDKHDATRKDSVAIGDSAGDISMLEMVESPIALNPEKKLYETAEQNEWKIVIERKNMIYELENKNGKYELAKTN